MSRDRVRLQNLRHFTAQIRRPSDDAIVGTGIAVSMDGQVVTCAHVVEAALGVHPRQADGAEVGDLDADALRHGSGQAGQHDSARQHHDQALKIARGITHRRALIEALLARGRWPGRTWRQGTGKPPAQKPSAPNA
jgi:hypothetical protein